MEFDTMVKSFSAQVDEIVRKTKARMEAVVRQSVQDVIDIAQTPTAKGGNMHVDTGFLRASGQLSLTGMPSGPVRGELTAPNSYPSPEDFSTSATVLKLADWKLGDTIYFGWTANYAVYREAYDGFLIGATEQWSQIVDKNVAELMRRIK